MSTAESPQGQILRLANKLALPIEEITDGYHTFNELYEFRKLYNAALFNELAIQQFIKENKKLTNPYNIHKSKKHHDGELCFGGGWFIVIADLPTGQISNHYKEENWDLFQIPETEKALIPFDGHTSGDVTKRLKEFILNVKYIKYE